ncbi:hypothetical protein GY45DRAFT_1340643 [Cubamyces sp. BRFM 1775]|nr:hypothetical protein GY45DRAFT_1340643 [Cubamyces sp. BRFM 1775]
MPRSKTDTTSQSRDSVDSSNREGRNAETGQRNDAVAYNVRQPSSPTAQTASLDSSYSPWGASAYGPAPASPPTSSMVYYPGSGYQSPALASSGVQSMNVSPIRTPLAVHSGLRRAVHSHRDSPSQSAYASPARQSSGVLSPQDPRGGYPNPDQGSTTNRAAGRSTAGTGVSGYPGGPSGLQQPFGGAFPGNPNHRHTESNPFPNPSDPQYRLRPRAQSGGTDASSKGLGGKRERRG